MRAATLASFVCVCALSLCGCGDDNDERSGAASLQDAAAHTLDSLPYHFDLAVEFRERGRKIVGHGHGAGDRETLDYTVRYPPSGTGEEPIPSRYLVDHREGRLDTYVDNPAPEMAGGKHWLRFDSLPTFRRYGLEPSDVPAADLRTPAAFFELLRRADGRVRELGEASVDGAATTHYRVRLDNEDVIRSAAPEKRAAVRKLLGGRPLRLVADLWVDQSGLIARLRERESGGPDTTVQTLTFHDWGEPFTLRLPPPNDVADGNKLGR